MFDQIFKIDSGITLQLVRHKSLKKKIKELNDTAITTYSHSISIISIKISGEQDT